VLSFSLKCSRRGGPEGTNLPSRLKREKRGKSQRKNYCNGLSE
jgi:hypothetical protein